MDEFKRYLKLDLPKPYSAFLWGARQTGKSTYLRTAFPNSHYLDFLQTDIFERYVNHPYYLRQELQSAFVDGRLKHPVILDEVQKIPQLLDEVAFGSKSALTARFFSLY